MLGNFAACPTNVVCIGSLAPRFRVAAASCSARRLCALCVAPFPQHPVGSRLSCLVPRTGPPLPSLFLLLLVTRPPARLPHRVDLPLFSPLFFPCRSHRKRTVSPTLSPQHAPSMYPIPAASTSGVLRPNSVRLYKIPLVLALLLHPHSSHIHSRATKSSCRCEARFGSLRS